MRFAILSVLVLAGCRAHAPTADAGKDLDGAPTSFDYRSDSQYRLALAAMLESGPGRRFAETTTRFFDYGYRLGLQDGAPHAKWSLRQASEKGCARGLWKLTILNTADAPAPNECAQPGEVAPTKDTYQSSDYATARLAVVKRTVDLDPDDAQLLTRAFDTAYESAVRAEETRAGLPAATEDHFKSGCIHARELSVSSSAPVTAVETLPEFCATESREYGRAAMSGMTR